MRAMEPRGHMVTARALQPASPGLVRAEVWLCNPEQLHDLSEPVSEALVVPSALGPFRGPFSWREAGRRGGSAAWRQRAPALERA